VSEREREREEEGGEGRADGQGTWEEEVGRTTGKERRREGAKLRLELPGRCRGAVWCSLAALGGGWVVCAWGKLVMELGRCGCRRSLPAPRRAFWDKLRVELPGGF